LGIVAFNPRSDALSDSLVAALSRSLRSSDETRSIAVIAARDLERAMDNEFEFREKDRRELEGLGMAVRGDALLNVRARRRSDSLVVSGVMYYPRRLTSAGLQLRSAHDPQVLGPWIVRALPDGEQRMMAWILSDSVLARFAGPK
jgi:hypothetical protein